MNSTCEAYWACQNLLTVVTVTNNYEWLQNSLINKNRASEKYFRIVKVLSTPSNEYIKLDENSNLMIISSYDSGIYDALNQALLHVKTPYYLVLGDDDTLDEQVLFDSLLKYSQILIALNPSVIKFKSYNKSTKKIASYHSVSHILKVDLHMRYGYYSKLFKIASDQLFLNKISKEITFESNEIIGIYGGDGISSKGWRLHIEHRLSQLIKLFFK